LVDSSKRRTIPLRTCKNLVMILFISSYLGSQVAGALRRQGSLVLSSAAPAHKCCSGFVCHHRKFKVPSISPRDLRSRFPKFFGIIAYPSMKGTFHVGHGLTDSKVDFAAGYERIQGSSYQHGINTIQNIFVTSQGQVR
jgi:hypothetical protein